MKMKKVIALALSLVMVSGLLVGCGSGNDTQESSSEPSSSEESSSVEVVESEPSVEASSAEVESETSGTATAVNTDYVGEYVYE